MSSGQEYCFHFPRNFRWFPAISPKCSGKCIGSGRFRPYIFDLSIEINLYTQSMY
jgi:hypothetical protein